MRFKDISHGKNGLEQFNQRKNNIQNIILNIESLEEYDYFGQRLNIYKGQANRKYHFSKLKKVVSGIIRNTWEIIVIGFGGGHTYCLSRKSIRIIKMNII